MKKRKHEWRENIQFSKNNISLIQRIINKLRNTILDKRSEHRRSNKEVNYKKSNRRVKERRSGL